MVPLPAPGAESVARPGKGLVWFEGLWPRSADDEALAHRDDGSLGPVGRSKLAEDPGQVVADSPLANCQAPGDLLVRLARREVLHDVQLASRKQQRPSRLRRAV